jgi:hypothetical protein
MPVSTSRIRTRGALRSIAVHTVVVGVRVAVAAVVAAAQAGASRVARVTMPIYLPALRQARETQASQEAMRNATNIVATMDSARSTHTAPENSAVAVNAKGKVENRVVNRASRTADVRLAVPGVAVAVVKVGSRVARAPVAAAAALADPAMAAAFLA